MMNDVTNVTLKTNHTEKKENKNMERRTEIKKACERFEEIAKNDIGLKIAILKTDKILGRDMLDKIEIKDRETLDDWIGRFKTYLRSFGKDEFDWVNLMIFQSYFAYIHNACKKDKYYSKLLDAILNVTYADGGNVVEAEYLDDAVEKFGKDNFKGLTYEEWVELLQKRFIIQSVFTRRDNLARDCVNEYLNDNRTPIDEMFGLMYYIEKTIKTDSLGAYAVYSSLQRHMVDYLIDFITDINIVNLVDNYVPEQDALGKEEEEEKASVGDTSEVAICPLSDFVKDLETGIYNGACLKPVEGTSALEPLFYMENVLSYVNNRMYWISEMEFSSAILANVGIISILAKDTSVREYAIKESINLIMQYTTMYESQRYAYRKQLITTDLENCMAMLSLATEEELNDPKYRYTFIFDDYMRRSNLAIIASNPENMW